MAERKTRVLVIDDSAYNRQTITSMLTRVRGIEVVARAGDGNEGLKQVFTHSPDVITLDLEMPRMDGFTFLRILMNRRPTPVIVISSYAHQENVFKALELGALDFIAKPTQTISPELHAIEESLVAKIRMLAQLRRVSLAGRGELPGVVAPEDVLPAASNLPLRAVAIGSSTGGPPALKQILAAIPGGLPLTILISQHMPASFTAAFAERLDRASAMEIREAQDGDLVDAGVGLVAPGSGSLCLDRDHLGNVRVRIETGEDEVVHGTRPRYVPSIDRMFSCAARVFSKELLGVVLTGMGDDGSRGIREVKEAGGATMAESEETAVIFGMPDEAIRTGAIDEIVPLEKVATAIIHHAEAKRLVGLPDEGED